ncbi:hypothetical protein [Paramicrobacterium fandaimingii]|uniref:hypothetical protein n=1 Tax=Paramicrobacterium fandaimingii TaxID=2708079 RepID=UPI00142389D7|nr:hypothetical protein [Microbacterium fandaimingii]
MHKADVPRSNEQKSALAAELRTIPINVRRALGIPNIVPDALDIAILTLHEILDESTDGSWESRLGRLPERIEWLFPNGFPADKIAHLSNMSETAMTAELDRHFARFKNGSAQRFLNRLLGTKEFHRLEMAFETDWALILVGFRRLLRAVMPVAQALEDAAFPLSKSELKALAILSESETVYLRLTLQLDQMIGAYFEHRDMSLKGMGFPVRASEEITPSVDLDQLVATMRGLLDLEAERRAGELSEVLLRKLRGFEQALDNSEDGVSQAASSLVEFIDRLLRTAFTRDEILQWTSTHLPGDKLMTFERAGVVQPTKRAAALCFAFAGQTPAYDSTLQTMVALSLVKVRAAAEKIKHADRGTVEEQAELRQLMQSVRGALIFIIRFSWLMGESSRYENLRQRFIKAA